LNLTAKQKYRQKHQSHHKRLQSLRQDESTNSQKSSDITPYTVEKGINAIKCDSSHSSQERRPKLMREFSMGSESDLDILPIDADIDSRKYPQIPVSSPTIIGRRVRTSPTANYLSLV
jgi:hypothetical protein